MQHAFAINDEAYICALRLDGPLIPRPFSPGVPGEKGAVVFRGSSRSVSALPARGRWSQGGLGFANILSSTPTVWRK